MQIEHDAIGLACVAIVVVTLSCMGIRRERRDDVVNGWNFFGVVSLELATFALDLVDVTSNKFDRLLLEIGANLTLFNFDDEVVFVVVIVRFLFC